MFAQMNCKKFRLISCIGEGAFGIVYQAINLQTNNKVAVKCIKTNQALGALENMKREANIHSTLEHVNIVALKSFALQNNFYNWN
ncbi:kinase-like protein [Meira miltonrushii]|uniref:Kinase-like protein n=1 Tax=Meira miltonrushii TaxID=1280837 RepID=A0A316V191_9BASI|nr:kinase-like protein [Meira miltonrushii]PWN31319.1 kinase-like protein [Meira miltonrushii]